MSSVPLWDLSLLRKHLMVNSLDGDRCSILAHALGVLRFRFPREPDEGNLHVRFDEGRIGRLLAAYSPTLPAKSPRLISSLSWPLLRRLFSLRGELQRACYTGRNSLRDRHARIEDLWSSSWRVLQTR